MRRGPQLVGLVWGGPKRRPKAARVILPQEAQWGAEIPWMVGMGKSHFQRLKKYRRSGRNPYFRSSKTEGRGVR
jgi:hypothetical protein